MEIFCEEFVLLVVVLLSEVTIVLELVVLVVLEETIELFKSKAMLLALEILEEAVILVLSGLFETLRVVLLGLLRIELELLLILIAISLTAALENACRL